MKISHIVFIISFILDGLISNFTNTYYNNSTLLFPMFSIISLILIYPFFNNNDKNYLKTVTIFGLLYDIVYTNTLFLNMLTFFIIGIIIKFIYLLIPTNSISNALSSVFIITVYCILNIVILNILNYNVYHLSDLFYIVTHALIINIIYTLIGYFILNYISKKYKIKKID